MTIESKNVFLVHPLNERFLRGDVALPENWNANFVPFLILKGVLLWIACGLFLKSVGLDFHSFLPGIAAASLAYLVYSCVGHIVKKRNLEAAVRRGRFIFTKDYEVSFFNDESSNCVVKFSFPHSQLLSGQEQGDGRKEDLKSGMYLCALFIDENRFFIM